MSAKRTSVWYMGQQLGNLVSGAADYVNGLAEKKRQEEAYRKLREEMSQPVRPVAQNEPQTTSAPVFAPTPDHAITDTSAAASSPNILAQRPSARVAPTPRLMDTLAPPVVQGQNIAAPSPIPVMPAQGNTTMEQATRGAQFGQNATMARPGEEDNLAMLDFLQGLNAPALSAFSERERRRTVTPHVYGGAEGGFFNSPSNYRGEITGTTKIAPGMGYKPLQPNIHHTLSNKGGRRIDTVFVNGRPYNQTDVGDAEVHNNALANSKAVKLEEWKDKRTQAQKSMNTLIGTHGRINLDAYAAKVDEVQKQMGADVNDEAGFAAIVNAIAGSDLGDQEKAQMKLGLDYLKAKSAYDAADEIVKRRATGKEDDTNTDTGKVPIWGPKK